LVVGTAAVASLFLQPYEVTLLMIGISLLGNIEAAESATSAGEVAVAGQAAIQEAVDTLVSEGVVTTTGAAAILEAADTIAATGEISVAGQAAIQEQADTLGSEAVAAMASLPITPSAAGFTGREWRFIAASNAATAGISGALSLVRSARQA
jgi:hypothetical protein